MTNRDFLFTAHLQNGPGQVPESLLLRVLGLKAMPTSPQVVRTAARNRILQVHPDYNAEGSYEEILEVRWAKEALLILLDIQETLGIMDPPLLLGETQESRVSATLLRDTGKLKQSWGRRIRWGKKPMYRPCEQCGKDMVVALGVVDHKVPGTDFEVLEVQDRKPGPRQRFCSAACRQKAWRARKATEPRG